jgi:hypothetical protein
MVMEFYLSFEQLSQRIGIESPATPGRKSAPAQLFSSWTSAFLLTVERNGWHRPLHHVMKDNRLMIRLGNAGR